MICKNYFNLLFLSKINYQSNLQTKGHYIYLKFRKNHKILKSNRIILQNILIDYYTNKIISLFKNYIIYAC